MTEKATRSGTEKGIQILSLLFMKYVIIGKSLKLSDPHFPFLQSGDNNSAM